PAPRPLPPSTGPSWLAPLTRTLCIQLLQMPQLFGYADFQPALDRLIIVARLDGLGKIILASCIGIGLVVGVAVFLAIAKVFHQLGWRIAQMQRYFQRT